MSQITIYLDDSLESKVRQRAKQEGISVSKWIANAIVASEHDVWPEHVLASFGTWTDVPDLEELRRGYGKDSPRDNLD
ncbi:MAG: ribbon-helix-helix protein, CopG family [Acidobacteria bacterium]|nr:ribbon-helix-helix protein, CopG family [Acidobacteriota bacterium]